MKTIEVNSTEELAYAAQQFVMMTQGHKKFAFYGPMGSGKTTFIKAICKELGATSLVTSPTFSLVNEYNTDHESVLYHFDLYRINSIEELYDLGFEEYFYGNQYVFIEWAEKAEELLPDPVIRITLQEITPEKRLISVAV